MDNVARGAILNGIPTADAELVCHEASAHAMWSRFVDKKTKRSYAITSVTLITAQVSVVGSVIQ
ncbi:hypothetical protein DD238_007816 [Peronospora effusa]|uniref:Uncharacterized protein n=1 Tax=Peronospora effusa TaxID=542832 RepID=A0A3M6VRI4_9STRA|nr:hypothetical protein DD238_007816 [Peronospora effusa]